MNGLMQDRPLDVPTIVRHAERMHSRKTVTTRTANGLATATFAEVLERARRLVAALRALGVRPGDRVATFCWNHQQHLEAYLGVPCMGAVVHTLNIRLFERDLAYIVEHAEDRVAIVDRSLLPAWAKVAARVSCVRDVIVVDDGGAEALPAGAHDYEALLAAHAPARDLADIEEDRAAGLCYTSGTTGNPKGVVYSHRSNFLHAIVLGSADAMGVCEQDVVLPIVPMFHANAWGLPYATFLWGADLVLPGRFLAPAQILELLLERGVTLAAGVPTLWLGLIDPLRKVRERLGSLKRILCGGSAVPRALQRAYREELGVPIVHAWGMTETSPLGSLARPLAAHRGADRDTLEEVLGSQGRVVPLVEIRLVGEDGREVAWDGASLGEIHVRGPWIAAAYYKDEAASAARFADGWLKTGDVASPDPLGYVRIADRTKDLVKSGGEWISSVALEGLLMGHPGVAEAAVIAVAHARWGERPLACVVPRPDARGRLTKEELLDYLRPLVARWWLPDDVVFVDEVPKTSVGKFDKKVLRERFKEHVLPETPPKEP